MNIIWRGSPNYSSRLIYKVEYIVIHWFGTGTLASADSRFRNPASDVSAHYGISGKTVYQWVREEKAAWNAGNWFANKKSIGIEHDATTTKNASNDTYATSAQLVASIWKRLGRVVPLKPHKAFDATQCPGTLDLNRIYREAMAIYAPKPVAPKTFKVTVIRTCNVRSKPTTTAPLAGSKTLNKGDVFTGVAVVEGQSINGNNKWVKSLRGNYVWSGNLSYKR